MVSYQILLVLSLAVFLIAFSDFRSDTLPAKSVNSMTHTSIASISKEVTSENELVFVAHQAADYTFRTLSTASYLEQKDVVVSAEDLEAIRRELVVIVDIKPQATTDNVSLEISSWTSQLKVRPQSNLQESYHAIHERGIQGAIHSVFFFADLNPDMAFEIIYTDLLLGDKTININKT